MNISRSQIVLLCLVALITVRSFSQSLYVDTVFDSIKVETFKYSKINDTILKMDIYSPKNDSSVVRPLLLIVHGGGFDTGMRNDPSIVYMAHKIAQKGYVVASIDYRLLAANENLSCDISKKFKLKTFEKAAEDIMEALLYIVKYKHDFKIDENKIILFGSSAGAETILNLTYNKNLVINQNYITSTPKIAAVISVSGAILDISLITDLNAVPGVFYHGTDDQVVPYALGSHHSCTSNDNGYLIEFGSKAIVEKLEQQKSSFLFYSYLKRKHDIFNLPPDDFHQAFVFIRKVVFDKAFYQSRILENF